MGAKRHALKHSTRRLAGHWDRCFGVRWEIDFDFRASISRRHIVNGQAQARLLDSDLDSKADCWVHIPLHSKAFCIGVFFCIVLYFRCSL